MNFYYSKIFIVMENTFIYGLVSKKEPEVIRYIGKADNPEYRKKRHIHNTKYDQKINKKLTHKDYWIIKENYEINFIILEECDKFNWQEREKYYLSKFDNLTNTSEGGKGGSGIKYRMSYHEVKEWIKHHLDVKSKSQWYKNIPILPDFIPANPREVYLKKGWVSWGDFLGTGKIWDNSIEYISYSDAKKIIKTLKINNGLEYKRFVKENKIPMKIPNRPDRYYKNRGWVSWGDFLGTGRIANQYKKRSEL